jgi:hypothetical protein
MKYLNYATRVGAENRSRAEATRRGCQPGNVTTHWWDVVEGVDGTFSCAIPDRFGEEDNLSAADRGRLSSTFQRKAKRTDSEE